MLVNTHKSSVTEKLIDSAPYSHAYRRTNVSKLSSTRVYVVASAFLGKGSVADSDDDVKVEFVALDAAR